MTTAASLTAALKDEAARLGFELAGACPAVTPPGIGRFEQWLSAGYAGEMRYLADRADAYRDPACVLDGARSILVFAAVYRSAEPADAGPGHARIARYAWGSDYHDVIHTRLGRLADLHRRLAPGAAVRGVVDTAPLLEREYAQLAGLGWIGKNTLLINRSLGSWFFLAALLTSEPLVYDPPFAADHCGTCRACLDACPTGALVAPYQLDARRCISYLTIEHRSQIPSDLRPRMDDWLFGCDICQDACPWNRRSPATDAPEFRPVENSNPLELAALFALDDAAFRRRFRATPLWRPKRRGLLRNAAIALGNRPEPGAIAALVRGLNDTEPLVRGACAWALARYDAPEAAAALQVRQAAERDSDVRGEIDRALARTSIGRPRVPLAPYALQ